MANENVEQQQQYRLKKYSRISKVNSLKEDEEYTCPHQRQPLQAVHPQNSSCTTNKGQQLYFPPNAAGCMLVGAFGVANVEKKHQSLSKTIGVARAVSTTNVMGQQPRPRRAHDQQQQRNGKRASRHSNYNQQPNSGVHLFCGAEFVQQRDMSPSASSSASSGISSLDNGHCGSERSTLSPSRNGMQRCSCDVCLMGDEHPSGEFTGDYSHYYMQQQHYHHHSHLNHHHHNQQQQRHHQQQQHQQNPWYRIQQQQQHYAEMMAAVCTARHAVALQMYRQQKDFYGVYATDGRIQTTAMTRIESGIPLSGNLDNGQTPAYGNYFMVPYEVIEAYLRFLESLYPQLAHNSQQAVEMSDPPALLSHPEVAEISSAVGLPSIANSASPACQAQCDRVPKDVASEHRVAQSEGGRADKMVRLHETTQQIAQKAINVREEGETQANGEQKGIKENFAQPIYKESSEVVCDEDEKEERLDDEQEQQFMQRPLNLELTPVSVQLYPSPEAATDNDVNIKEKANPKTGGMAQTGTSRSHGHLGDVASEKAEAERLYVPPESVSDGQAAGTGCWQGQKPVAQTPPELLTASHGGMLRASEGVVVAENATERVEQGQLVEQPSNEQLANVAELVEQPLPVNAAAIVNAPRLLRPPPASSFNRSGRFEVSKMDVLSEEIWDFHNTITQSEALLNRKLHLRDMLYCCISPVFPMCGLYVVGSSLNGFGNNSSDMDLCLMISHKDIDQRTDAVVVLGMIKSALSNVAWVREQQLIIAKVPILRIKFTDPFAEITVDLNANNSVAIRNTHLLCYYSSFDWRVRPLVSVVKEWAKRRDMNDANRSTFTSYSLVLMVIHYLQCGANPAVLPSLQELYPKRFNHRTDVRTLNVSIPLETPATGEWQFSEANTLGELLLGFLEYYAFKFDYVHDAISVRLGSRIERSFVARQRSPYNNSIAQWNCICIEEPFTLSNTAHSVHSQMVFDAIREAFVEGFEELDTNRDLNAFLNAPPIKIGANITPHGSGSHLNVLSAASNDRGEVTYDRMLHRTMNVTQALFLIDNGMSESSGHSSTASSPRSTPSNIEEQSSLTSSESTDGDFTRPLFKGITTASDQESCGGHAQPKRERRRLAITPPEVMNASKGEQVESHREQGRADESNKDDEEKLSKWQKEGSNNSQVERTMQQQQQGRARRRRNAVYKIQTLTGDAARLGSETSGEGRTRVNKKLFASGALSS